MSKKAVRAVAVLACMGISLPAMAGVILDWNGPDATAASPTSDIAINVGTPTDQGDIKNIIPGTPIMSTALDAQYIGNSIYGVIQTQNPGASPVDLDTAGSIFDVDSPALWIGVDGNVPAGADSLRNIAALISIDLDVAAAASDYISAMSFSTFGGGGIGDTGVRFAIESGGNWYISNQVTYEADTGLVINYDGSDFAQLTVATSSSTSLMTGNALTYDQDVTSLDNITSVGVFFEGTTPNNTARARIKLDGLTAEVIPEPATLGLFGITGATLLVIRRRRRK